MTLHLEKTMGSLTSYLRRLKRKLVPKKWSLKLAKPDCLRDPASGLGAIPDTCLRDRPYHYVGAVERLFKDVRHPSSTHGDPLGEIDLNSLVKLFTESTLGDGIIYRLHPQDGAPGEVPFQDYQPGVEDKMSETRRMSLDQERLAHLLF